tara:strand:+ start:884 stop:1105 length:222 start_codon:yes stop_codon:yes gene_type:complete
MNQDEKVEIETKRLNSNKVLLIEKLESILNLGLIDAQKQEELKKEINHLYNNEIDYLHQAPKDYFELYGDRVG